ncbi:MAG TPA: endonuclease/exonuclease/phosphatase family protein [Polyangiales bacterium]
MSSVSRSPMNVLLRWALWPVLLVSLFGFAGRYHWLLDLCAHFRVYYALGAALVAALAFVRRDAFTGSAALAVLVVNAALILPFYVYPREHLPAGAATLRLLHFNVDLDNYARHAEVGRYLDGSGADVVLVVETDRKWVDALHAALWHYTLVVSTTDGFRNKYYGSALFLRRAAAARVTVRDAQVVFLEPSRGHPSLAAHLQFAGRPIALLGVHQHPPYSAAHAGIRDEQFREAASWLRRQPSARIMLGDMNATPWSFHYRQLIERTGLLNAQLGFGLHPTWLPLRDHWLGVPIDHCLHSPQLAITSFAQGPNLGSDHRPLLVQLGWSVGQGG